MAPDVTFAWFIRHFTLSEELLLNASQISSCLLSSNCLWLTFNKSLKKDDEKWWRMWPPHSQPRGELFEMCSFPVVTPLPLSAHRPSQGSNSWQKPVTRQEICQKSPVSQEKVQTCLFWPAEKLQWNYINIFMASLFAAWGLKIYCMWMLNIHLPRNNEEAIRHN